MLQKTKHTYIFIQTYFAVFVYVNILYSFLLNNNKQKLDNNRKFAPMHKYSATVTLSMHSTNSSA